MSALWSAAEAAAATGGQAQGDWRVSGVSIDTRTLVPGDLFVALKDVRDGHDFVAQALAKGAGAALVSHVPEGVADDAPLLIVKDVLGALGALGRAGRARSKARMVAVTGSVGKTSTKDMLRVVLAQQGRTHAAQSSYNNHWGVPLTLARMPADTEYAVIEIGMNHPGEIAPLARIARPHVALITTVAAVHLEAFDNIEGIAREKGAIFEGLEPDGVAVIPDDVATAAILRAAAADAGGRQVAFGTDPALPFSLQDITLTAQGTVARACLHGQSLAYTLGTAGAHFAMNALGALAVVEALGADPLRAARDLGLWLPPAGRGMRQMVALPGGRFELIDDAFNASPASLSAALEVLAAAQPAGRRIAILGDMLELGPEELTLHANVAGDAHMGAVAQVHCVGPRMRALHEALPNTQRGVWAADASEMVRQAHRLVAPGDVVLVKGSKGSLVSRVVDALRELGQADAAARK